MRAAWSWVVLSVALLLSTRASDSTETSLTTTTLWEEVSTWGNNTDNNTTTSSADSDKTQTLTISTRPPPIYKTGVVSFADFVRIRHILSYVFVSLEAFALVLLSLSAVAFLRDRHPSNIYLASGCLAETWYMLMLFIHNLCKVRRECFTSLTYTQMSIWSVSYTGMVARRVAYVVNALVSIQRFVAIAFPLQARSYGVLQKPLIPLLILVLLSALLHLYRPLQYKPVFIEDDKGGSWTQGFSSRYADNKNVFVAIADVAKYLMIYLPMLLCLISNCLLIASLARHKKELQSVNSLKQDSSKAKAERQMTATILISTFLTIFFNTPININEAVSLYASDYGMVKKEHYLYLLMRSYFSIMSQSCDILVVLSYILLSANFRRRLAGLFRPLQRLVCCNRCRHQSSFASSVSGSQILSTPHTTQMEMANSVTRG